MRRTRVVVAAVVVLVALVGSGVGYLSLELSQTNADLQETREALVQSNADLVASIEAHNALAADFDTLVMQRNALVAERDALTGSLAETRTERDRLRAEAHELSEQNRTLAHEKAVLTQEHGHLQGVHEQLTTTHQQLGAQHEALQVSHLELQAAHEQLGASHEALQVSQQQLQASHETLQTSHEALDSSYKALNLKHTELQQTAGTVEELETQAGSLRTEIAQLEERRKPLILSQQSERIRGLLCTGSMEPKLTCLDTATWLHDYQPEEIVVGATISFESRACWSDEPSNSWTAHRVMDIRVTNGVHYYWPQGDANSGPDGCWVPESSVTGYMIEIHKNTTPENATLRDNVNAAKDAYVAARDAYRDLRQSYGCYDFTATCVVYSDFAYNALTAAYQRYSEAYDYYWGCWYRNAENSEYPGHIPYEC